MATQNLDNRWISPYCPTVSSLPMRNYDPLPHFIYIIVSVYVVWWCVVYRVVECGGGQGWWRWCLAAKGATV